MKISIAGLKIGWRALAGALAGVVGGGGLLFAASAISAAPPSKPAYLQAFPYFAPKLTPQMPGDVDIALKTSLEKAQKFAEVQREFDLYSWQMFLALNWPTNNQGQAGPSLTDTRFGAPHWTLWHNSADIFQTDGARPTACGPDPKARTLVLTRDMAKPVSKGLAAFSPAATANTDPRSTRFLGVISAVGELNAATPLSEIGQAFTGPLIDQNGEFVFYEIMIDPNEVGYLCDKSLYNINGQVAFSKGGGKVDMPVGTPQQDWSGSFELKLAWRILKPGKDDFSRFYTNPAVIMDQGPNGQPVERKVIVGLVGMHIGHKSTTSPQWIWSTFEQVDNLDVDPVAHPKLSPSFFDPNCPICAVNQLPQQVNGVYPRIPTQASRAIPIPGDKLALNAQAQATLKQLGSVWQYYQLIDTQWPTSPKTAPSPWNGGLPNAITNKPGGNPTPVMLTNITMETYFQIGNQQACHGEERPSGVNCPAVPPVWNSALNNKPPPLVKSDHPNTLTFQSESCMGCHSSAGVWTSYDPKTGQGSQSGQLSADFSWLLSQKASYQVGGGQ
jgi:hypothetical protein